MKKEDIKIPVVEIFKSVSGEGISAGEVVVFVRVAGCNLRCSYCDTKYSYNQNLEEYQYLTYEEIRERINKFNCNEVICTGGEPLERDQVKRYLPLYLVEQGFKVRIETNGSCQLYSKQELSEFKINSRDSDLNYTLDIKSPSSKMSDNNIFMDNFIKLESNDELKFVVGDNKDLEYALAVIEKYKDILAQRQVVINFSPIFEAIEVDKIVEFLKQESLFFTKNNLKVRLSLQLHKFIWPPEARGV
ncbi:radical SAM protein [Orenia marismortui]|uniref:radical SAM protein n=1 Tax=Orenia marismortui TaxID=46469 RepID=UPI00035C5AD5|nr:radical SAM protein [Orenia marismortui]